MNVSTGWLIVAAAMFAAGCGGASNSTTSAGTTYTVSVSVTGTTTHVSKVQVCLDYDLSSSACGTDGFSVGQHGSISVTTTAGTSYTVVVASNQQASAFCSVSSGASGVFGSSMPDAVINCF